MAWSGASAKARVALHHLHGGTLTDDDWTSIGRHLPDIGEARLPVDESPGLSTADLRTGSRHIASHEGLDMIVMAHLQLIT